MSTCLSRPIKSPSQNMFKIIFSFAITIIRAILSPHKCRRAPCLTQPATAPPSKRTSSKAPANFSTATALKMSRLVKSWPARPHPRRLLFLFQRQKRSLRRSPRLLLHRPQLEKLLGRRPRRSHLHRRWPPSRPRLSLPPAPRKRRKFLPHGRPAHRRRPQQSPRPPGLRTSFQRNGQRPRTQPNPKRPTPPHHRPSPRRPLRRRHGRSPRRLRPSPSRQPPRRLPNRSPPTRQLAHQKTPAQRCGETITSQNS